MSAYYVSFIIRKSISVGVFMKLVSASRDITINTTYKALCYEVNTNCISFLYATIDAWTVEGPTLCCIHLGNCCLEVPLINRREEEMRFCWSGGGERVNFCCPVKFWDRLHHPSVDDKWWDEVPFAAVESLMLFSLLENQGPSTGPEKAGHCKLWRAMFVKLFVDTVLDCDLIGW